MGKTIKLISSPTSKAMRILPTRFCCQVYVVMLIQIMAGFIDLIGVLDIGAISTSAVNSLQFKGPGSRVEEIC